MPGAKDPIKRKENQKCLRDSSVLEGKNNIGTSKKLQTQHSGSAVLLEKLEKTNILGINGLKLNQQSKIKIIRSIKLGSGIYQKNKLVLHAY